IMANVAVGAWQEQKANRVSEALEKMGTSTAQVLRAGQAVTIPANEVVPGDVLLLAPGDRVAADARVIRAQGLEVDEAALTGESLPVAKAPDAGSDANRIVLDGSDITTGTGRAVVVAVGRQTRMGATAAALSTEESEQSPLGTRLSQLLRLILPISIGGGARGAWAGGRGGGPRDWGVLTWEIFALTCFAAGLPCVTSERDRGGCA